MSGVILDPLFKGVTPTAAARTLGAHVKKIGADSIEKFIIPCAGNLTIPEALVSVGVDPKRIEFSDITLYTSALGYACDKTRAFGDLGFEVTSDEAKDIWKSCFGAEKDNSFRSFAALLCVMKWVQLAGDKDYIVWQRRQFESDLPDIAARYEGILQRMAERLDGSSYAIRDAHEHVKEVLDNPKALVWYNPPGYCMTPDARMLTADLRWVRCGNLKAGDEIVAFDEESGESPAKRNLKFATITRSEPVPAQCVVVRLADGSTVTCTRDHPWLIDRGESGATVCRKWVRAEDLLSAKHSKKDVATYALKFAQPWSYVESRDAGWLGGIFDGEGHLAIKADSTTLAASQRAGLVSDEIVAVADRLGFKMSSYGSGGANDDVLTHAVTGGFTEQLRFLGQTRPIRLIQKLRESELKNRSARGERVQVLSVEDVGEQVVQSISTSSRTYMGEGFLMHNSGGYSKMFAPRGHFKWKEPSIPELTPKDVSAFIGRLHDANAQVMIYATEGHALSAMDADAWHKLYSAADPKTRKRSYVLSNNPLPGDSVVSLRKPMALPSKVPSVYDEHELTKDSKIGYVKTTKDVALYFYDLFVRELGMVKAEVYYLFTVDGQVVGTCGFDIRTHIIKRIPVLYETFGLSMTSHRHGRIGRLLMASLCCREFVDQFTRENVNPSLMLPKITTIQTTCLTKFPEAKKNRGILKLTSREQTPDGRYHLVYRTDVHEKGYDAVMAEWQQKHAAHERE